MGNSVCGTLTFTAALFSTFFIFRRSFFAWHFTQKTLIFKRLSWLCANIFVVTMYASIIISFYSLVLHNKIENFHFSHCEKRLPIMQKSTGLIVWMQYFNKFHLFKFSEIFTIFLCNNNNLKPVRKSKKVFKLEKFQNSNLLWSLLYWPGPGIVWKQSTETEKKMVSDKIWSSKKQFSF